MQHTVNYPVTQIFMNQDFTNLNSEASRLGFRARVKKDRMLSG